MRPRSAVVRLFYGCLLIWIWTIPEASAVFKCLCRNLSTCYQQCNSTEEASGFNCFGWRTAQMVDYQCIWALKQYNTYDLHIYVKQKICKRILENQSGRTTPFTLNKHTSMTAYAFAVSEDKKRCIFANFTGSPSEMIHCSPPNHDNVTFTRRKGNLHVTATWHDNSVEKYYLKYRKQNSTLWKEVKSKNRKECTVGNLTSSLSYEIQIQCVVDRNCRQCPPSEVISIPPEFVDAPTITEIIKEPIRTGQREVIVKWQYVHSAAVDSYNVTVQKVSGELAGLSSYTLRTPTVTLILSYSAYNISIRAFNRAGSSPPAHKVIEAQEDLNVWNGQFNVSVKSNGGIHLSWNKTIAKKYACYSVEWWDTGKKAKYQSFYEKEDHHDVATKNATFKPYRRYNFFLHVRPEKKTCNLKNMNNGERTYGRAQAYRLEGTPLAAPGNLSISNITTSSCVLTWLPVAEEDLRGFLRGYIIYYYVDTHENSEKNITVDPHVNSYNLMNLQSRNVYRVQLSAYTAAGEGVRTDFMSCETNPDTAAVGGMLAAVIVGILVLLLSVHLCCRLLQRSKNLLWPSIPNPCNSNAVQKIEGDQELEMPLYKLNLEETEEHVTVVEVKKDTSCSRALILPDCVGDTFLTVASAAEDNMASLTNSLSADTCFVDTEEKDASLIPSHDSNSAEQRNNIIADTSDTLNSRTSDCVSTAAAKPAMIFVSDYTTMELFQQIAKVGLQGPSSQAGSSETVPSNLGQDYIRQALTYAEDIQQERCFW